MNLYMLIIVILILVPGYFLVNRFASKLFFGDENLEDETEKRYGFKKLEEELKKEAPPKKTKKNN